MEIGIIDADLIDGGTKHPNLALMKISGYWKDHDANVTLLSTCNVNTELFDLIYISKVFKFTNLDNPNIIKCDNVVYGGTGFFDDGGSGLPYEIEHHKPDYELYNSYIDQQISNGKSRKNFSNYLDFSIGFMTRGCFRHCEFCVNKKYDRAFRHSHLEEFYDPSKPYIYCWDDNVLAYPNWQEVFDELDAAKKPFQFKQGLDIRLLTDEKANRIASSMYHGAFIFAFDHIEDEELIKEKLRIWRNRTNRSTTLYCLCAYEGIDAVDISNLFERIRILMQFNCVPYVMRYENYKKSAYKCLYTDIARWCNQPSIFKKMSFREFCYKTQETKKRTDRVCSTLHSMREFEKEFPDIAIKYFDLKFDDLNLYKKKKYENEN